MEAVRAGAVNPPRQQRSRDTLERVVNALQRLLDSHNFDEVSVAQIARAAHSSVGAIYTRFPDKDALLDYLDTRLAADLVGRFESYLLDKQSRSARIETVVSHVVRLLVDFHRENRGVLRALAVRARGASGGRFAEASRHTGQQLPKLMFAILGHRKEIRHASPDQAVYLGFLMVLATVRERILFPDVYPARSQLSSGVLAGELTTAYLAYLNA